MFQEIKSLPENKTEALKEVFQGLFNFDSSSQFESNTALSKIFGSSKIMIGKQSLKSPFIRVDAQKKIFRGIETTKSILGVGIAWEDKEFQKLKAKKISMPGFDSDNKSPLMI